MYGARQNDHEHFMLLTNFKHEESGKQQLFISFSLFFVFFFLHFLRKVGEIYGKGALPIYYIPQHISSFLSFSFHQFFSFMLSPCCRLCLTIRFDSNKLTVTFGQSIVWNFINNLIFSLF